MFSAMMILHRLKHNIYRKQQVTTQHTQETIGHNTTYTGNNRSQHNIHRKQQVTTQHTQETKGHGRGLADKCISFSKSENAILNLI